MLPPHPLIKIPTRKLLLWFLLLLTVTLGISALFYHWDQALRHPGAPFGIVSLELAWSLAGVHQVIDPWTESARQIFLQLTIADYVYMVCYSTLLAVICLLLGRWSAARGRVHWSHFWEGAAWWPWIAAGCDAIENAASLGLLLLQPVDPWPLVMSAAASVKFVILLVLVTLIWFGTVFLIFMPKRTTQ